MTEAKLTGIRGPARSDGHERARLGVHGMMVRTGLLVVSAALLGGCINVTAPEEPIVIELNINIRAEVLYRLAEDAAETIDENADIF